MYALKQHVLETLKGIFNLISCFWSLNKFTQFQQNSKTRFEFKGYCFKCGSCCRLGKEIILEFKSPKSQFDESKFKRHSM